MIHPKFRLKIKREEKFKAVRNASSYREENFDESTFNPICAIKSTFSEIIADNILGINFQVYIYSVERKTEKQEGRNNIIGTYV